MLHTLKLILPALIPSWRFFDVIMVSPRVEFTLLKTPQDIPQWQEFRPRPERLPVISMMKRMLWNSQWNESLFLISCAERIMENPTEHSSREIVARIENELERHPTETATMPYLQFRIAFISREVDQLHKNIAFVSPAYLRTRRTYA